MSDNPTDSAAPVRVIEETPAYWRVLFDNPPLNVVDTAVFEGLQGLLGRMDGSPDLRVVVFVIDRDPDARIARRAYGFGELRQQRGLAGTARRADDGDGMHARRLVEPLDQRGTGDRALAQARDAKLRDRQDRQDSGQARDPPRREPSHRA